MHSNSAKHWSSDSHTSHQMSSPAVSQSHTTYACKLARMTHTQPPQATTDSVAYTHLVRLVLTLFLNIPQPGELCTQSKLSAQSGTRCCTTAAWVLSIIQRSVFTPSICVLHTVLPNARAVLDVNNSVDLSRTDRQAPPHSNAWHAHIHSITHISKEHTCRMCSTHSYTHTLLKTAAHFHTPFLPCLPHPILLLRYQAVLHTLQRRATSLFIQRQAHQQTYPYTAACAL